MQALERTVVQKTRKNVFHQAHLILVSIFNIKKGKCRCFVWKSSKLSFKAVTTDTLTVFGNVAFSLMVLQFKRFIVSP